MWYVTQNKCFWSWSVIPDICVNPLTGLYVRICVDPSPAGVRCWYPLTRLYVYVMCICETVPWSIICMWFQMTLRCDYICIIWFIICFRIIILISLNEFVKNQNTRALFDSIPLCILYNYLLDVWLTPSITIFQIKV